MGDKELFKSCFLTVPKKLFFERGSEFMAKTVGIGLQDFEKVRMEDIFYIDKTHFIK